jgi:hypothetical protein
MSALLARILELERQVIHWRNKYHDMRRGRDMWRNRAMRRGL